MLRNYFKIAWRNLKQNKSYTIINVIGLAVAIAACLLIGFWVQRELSYDHFNKKADRIYRVNVKATAGNGMSKNVAVTPNIVAPFLTRNFPEVEKAVRLNPASGVVRYHNHSFRENDFFFADSTFFNVFTFHFFKGNPKTALSSPGSVVITQSAARRYFGSGNPIGKTITFQDHYKLEVTGVIKNVPPTSHFHFEFIASWVSQDGWQAHTLTWNNADFYTYLLLHKHVRAAHLQQKVDYLTHKLFKGNNKLVLMPLLRLHLYANLAYALDKTGDIRYVYSFGAIALLILLIACINYMNLATARSAERVQEIGVRKVMGATRGQLMRQFYGEAGILVGISLCLGIALTQLFMPLFNDLAGTSFALESLPARMLLILVGIFVLITFIAGSYPALSLSVFNPSNVLKGSFQMKKRNAHLRGGLVIFQFAIAVFLIVCTFVIRDQLNFLQNKNLGFDKEHVVVIPSNDASLKSAFEQQKGVQSVSLVNQFPSHLGWTDVATAPGVPDTVTVKCLITDNHIIQTLGLTLMAGHNFREMPSAPDSTSGYHYILNQAAAQAFGWTPKKAVNKQFRVMKQYGKVIGVVKNFNFASLRKSIEPMVIWYQTSQMHYLLVHIAPGHAKRTLASLKNRWKAVNPHTPFVYQFLDDSFEALYHDEQQMGHIIGVFAGLAIFIACLGLFAMAAFAAERRTKEIGIRKVLGASELSIVGLLSKDFLKLVAIGFVIAVPIGWYAMHRWLQNFAYKITMSWWIFLLAGGIALVIALATVSWQSIRAALANPVDSLRSE
jgi:putative ABC transport system permease protein